jgi:hypothetical protein
MYAGGQNRVPHEQTANQVRAEMADAVGGVFMAINLEKPK